MTHMLEALDIAEVEDKERQKKLTLLLNACDALVVLYVSGARLTDGRFDDAINTLAQETARTRQAFYQKRRGTKCSSK